MCQLMITMEQVRPASRDVASSSFPEIEYSIRGEGKEEKKEKVEVGEEEGKGEDEEEKEEEEGKGSSIQKTK